MRCHSICIFPPPWAAVDGRFPSSLTVAGRWFARASRISCRRITGLTQTYFLSLELDSSLCANTLLERMLDLAHLGHQVGDLDDLRFCVSAGEHHVKHGWFIA